MNRRRLLIIGLLLLIVAAMVTWRMTRQYDPRLLGAWQVTRDPDSGLSEQWGFRANGSGWRNSEFAFDVTPPQFMVINHCWWTRGDRLFIEWGSVPTGRNELQETIAEFYDVVRGRRSQQPPDEYTFSVQRDGRIRIAAKKRSRNQEQPVVYLTRIQRDPEARQP